jgi:hypothetical protein
LTTRFQLSAGGAVCRPNHKKVYFFLMTGRGGDVTQHDFEVDAVRWFPIDEAVERASYRTERQVLRQVKERGGLPC